jgi:hypothetical protein
VHCPNQLWKQSPSFDDCWSPTRKMSRTSSCETLQVPKKKYPRISSVSTPAESDAKSISTPNPTAGLVRPSLQTIPPINSSVSHLSHEPTK